MQKIQTIVVGTDLSPTSEQAVESARRIAAKFDAREVHLVYVVNTSPTWSLLPYGLEAAHMQVAEKKAQENAEARLDELYKDGFGGAKVVRKVLLGIPARELSDYASDASADLIVVSTHGYGAIGRAVLGSLATTLIRIAACPVLVTGEERAYTAEHPVLAAVDLSPASTEVLGWASSMAAGGGRRLWVSSFQEHPDVLASDDGLLPRYVPPDELSRLAERQAKALRSVVEDAVPDEVHCELEIAEQTPPANAILQRAEILEPGLIVIGTSGRNAWNRALVGSTAGKVVSEAHAPVLVVPHSLVPDMHALRDAPASA